jgi:hypothetical protein
MRSSWADDQRAGAGEARPPSPGIFIVRTHGLFGHDLPVAIEGAARPRRHGGGMCGVNVVGVLCGGTSSYTVRLHAAQLGFGSGHFKYPNSNYALLPGNRPGNRKGPVAGCVGSKQQQRVGAVACSGHA